MDESEEPGEVDASSSPASLCPLVSTCQRRVVPALGHALPAYYHSGDAAHIHRGETLVPLNLSARRSCCSLGRGESLSATALRICSLFRTHEPMDCQDTVAALFRIGKRVVTDELRKEQ
jgi:hypothetical protein